MPERPPAGGDHVAALDRRSLDRLVGFGRYLRASGLPVGTDRILTFCRAAAVLDPFDREDLRAVARTTLVSHPDHLAMLDDLFDRYFGEGDLAAPVDEEARAAAPVARPAPGRAEDHPGGLSRAASWSGLRPGEQTEGEAAIRVVASEAEILRTKDFAEMSDAERRAASVLIRRLAISVPRRRVRRTEAAAKGRRFDLRRTLRRSLRTEGEPFSRAWRRRRTRSRPLVLLLDVSGSMAPYIRPMVEFAHAAATTGRRVEAFCFGTRLTRITRALDRRDPAEALAAVGDAVRDWEGGTRIGTSLKQLLDEWSRRSALRGSVVVMCSDGLERGEPAFLAGQMERLARLAHRVVWVNPLKGSPQYEPLARGMAASLPFVDAFLPGHDLESLESLAEAVATA